MFINTVLLQVGCERTYLYNRERRGLAYATDVEVLLLCVYWGCVVTSFELKIVCPNDPSTVLHQENWRYLL